MRYDQWLHCLSEGAHPHVVWSGWIQIDFPLDILPTSELELLVVQARVPRVESRPRGLAASVPAYHDFTYPFTVNDMADGFLHVPAK